MLSPSNNKELRKSAEQFAAEKIELTMPPFVVKAKDVDNPKVELQLPCYTLRAAAHMCLEFDHAVIELSPEETMRRLLRIAFQSGAGWLKHQVEEHSEIQIIDGTPVVCISKAKLLDLLGLKEA